MTENEKKLLTAIAKGNDRPGEAWLHEVAEESHSTAGTLGSLIKKGFATSCEESEPGMPVCYWVAITPEGVRSLA